MNEQPVVMPLTFLFSLHLLHLLLAVCSALHHLSVHILILTVILAHLLLLVHIVLIHLLLLHFRRGRVHLFKLTHTDY